MAYSQLHTTNEPIRHERIFFSFFSRSNLKFHLLTCVAFLKVKIEIMSMKLRFRTCSHGVGDPGLVGLVSFVFTLWGTQNKKTYPTKRGSPTPCKQGLNQSGGLYDNGRILPVTLLAKGFWISIIMWNLNLQSAQKL